MKLPNLKSKKSNLLDGITPIVALDIGTESVKSLLFTIGEYGVSVNRISRIQQQQHAMRSGIITNLDTVLENCKLAINQLLSNLKVEELLTTKEKRILKKRLQRRNRTGLLHKLKLKLLLMEKMT